jgi:hypothetical protein
MLIHHNILNSHSPIPISKLKYIIKSGDKIMMIKYFITTLLMFHLAWSAPLAPADDQVEESNSAYYLKELSKDNPQLGLALSIDEVKDIYEQCFKKYSANNFIDGKKIVTCVWNDQDNKDPNPIAGVSSKPELEKQVYELMNQSEESDEYKALAGSHYEKNIQGEKAYSPALKKLKEHMQKELEKALYSGGMGTGKKLERFADQAVFFKLFQSQLGKNVITALTSYCLETDITAGSPYLISDKPEVAREARKKNLGKLKISNGSMDIYSNKKQGDWRECIVDIQRICSYQGELKKDGFPEKITKVPNPTTGIDENVDKYSYDGLKKLCNDRSKSSNKPVNCEKTVETSNTRACEVTEYIKKARLNILAVDKTLKKFETDLASKAKGVAPVAEFGTEKTIDELTTLTSKEIFDSGYAKAKEEELAEFEKCYQKGKIVDATACEKYLNKDAKAAYADMSELKLKQESIQKKIEDLITNSDEEQLKTFLVEDGYSEQDAEEIAKIQGMRARIIEKYENQKNALIASTQKEIDRLTSATDGSIENIDENKDKLQKIDARLRSDTQKFAELVHFNNIVSSYLTIDSGDGKNTEANEAVRARELASTAFDANTAKELKKEYGQTFDASYTLEDSLQQEVGSGGGTGGKDDTDQVTLGAQNISDAFLNYFKKDP